MSVDLHHGDAVDVFRNLRGLASILADPPGGGSFMELAFDTSRGGRDRWIPYWSERFKVAREATERGSYGLFWSFGRPAHWTACALDDAKWEIVRPILHIHGQGWTKSNKSQLKPAQETWWLCRWGGVSPLQIDRCRVRRTWAERPESWFRSGHSTKPEVAKIGGAPAGNGIHVHEGGSWPTDIVFSHCQSCRLIGTRTIEGAAGGNRRLQAFGLLSDDAWRSRETTMHRHEGSTVEIPAWACLAACACGLASLAPAGGAPAPCPGCDDERWWACPVAECDSQSGVTKSGKMAAGTQREGVGYGGGLGTTVRNETWGDEGGPSRFYPTFHYDAKASARERQSGCEHLLWIEDDAAPIGWRRVTVEEYGRAPVAERKTGNVHATIKPIGAGAEDGLTRWLLRLITPPVGRVGDITMGSGSTGVAAQIEGHYFVGCDIDPGAVDIARARCAFWTQERHRQVLADATVLKARELQAERERALREGPRHDDLPLFAAATSQCEGDTAALPLSQRSSR
jgi:hypothetical protein